MSIITLTTDFGLKDHFVGALKGKIITEHPQAQIFDISHNVDLFNISEASYIISAAYNSFPKQTVHIIGVDSERTPENKHIAMQWNDHYFICADNGILSILTQKIVPQKIVEINVHDRFPEGTSDMEVFVKVACHLSKGGVMSVIGREISSLKTINELQAIVASDFSSIKGAVVYIDHFGNCVTNISQKMIQDTAKGRSFEVKFGTKTIRSIHKSYSDFKVTDKFTLKDFEGERLALFNEADFLEIAIYKSNPSTVGSATSLLGLKFRDTVTIQFT
ncbi:hypothetical protein FEDK69T_02300 [Flavobacterium enshiense DK69]|uniref:S-adenosyl-l-methionine hydroxide adenosyltransferase n=1 Tax=Flavobacterium enshiense DK69 TaxID=1107311 RepID=V6SEM7_9FLAO|nr:SAM-dependent chlorinase/fluorinase [Flavobacterium enshiense]ESU25041.1 hypothetical protein FEDK69T_02300 [Flavobacterium enshiense DK69]KGO96855.1 hypothetical protein Q767_03920 [Flavobacterium enshiense DK69]